MKNIFLTLSFLGCVGLASAWLAPEVMKWHEETLQASQTAVAENLVKDSGFDHADFSKKYNDKPLVYDEWLTYKDESKDPTVSFAVVDDTEQGKVASYKGRATSYYTSFFAQRIKTVAKKGIYKLSFMGKSPDGGRVRLYIPTSKADGSDSGRYFLLKDGRPTDPATKWYGALYHPSLTTEWQEYSVEFDFTMIINSTYSVPLADAVEATEEDLTNFSLRFQGENADKTILIDNVKLELVEDLSDPKPEPTNAFIKDSGFDNADISKSYAAIPYIFGAWVTHIDSRYDTTVSYTVVDDADQGKVASITGKAQSYYTSHLSQRIDTVAKKGIYKLTFLGKTPDGGKVKIYVPTTGADGKDTGSYFIKKTGQPADPTSKWYGAYYNTSFTSEWKEYSVEFDFTKTINTVYSVPLADAKDATLEDLTDFTLRFQGDAADKTILIDNVKLELIEDLSEPEEPEEPTVNVLKDSDFENNPDLTLREEEPDPAIYGEWIARRDKAEQKDAKVEMKEDAVQGKVVALVNKPTSYYTTYISQRIEGTLPEGIYRLSFKGRSDDGGQVRMFVDSKGTKFIKETGRPSDPTQKWYGCWQSFGFTSSWKEYYVDFNLSKTANSMYQWTFDDGIVRNATDDMRTGVNITILGHGDNATAYIDDVQFAKIADIDEGDQELIIKHDFEEAVIPGVWKATGSEIALSTEHYKTGKKALCWNAADKATLELSFGGSLKMNEQNAARFNIYSMNANNDTIYTEFLTSDNQVVKKATMLVNFKGWREFSRSYVEYAHKETAKAEKVRFTYKVKEGAGQKIYFDNMDFNSMVDGKRRYPDMMVLDVDYLEKANAAFLQVYSYGASVTPEEPTTEEIKDFDVLKENFRRSPTGNNGMIKALLAKVAAMNIVRNEDGTVSGDALPSAKELTIDYVRELSEAVEVLSASSNSQAKSAFNLLVDHIIDQGVLYNFAGFTYSDYGTVRKVPTGFLNAMDKYNEAQRAEMIKGIKWIVEFGIAYTPVEYLHAHLSSDYIYNYLSHLYGCAANNPDRNTAIENMKALTHFLENVSEYAPGGREVLKPDGTGFHHDTHYNGYMYAYTPWVEYIGKLKGTCFRINKDAYERIKKAVVSMYIMSTKSSNGIFTAANSMAGRHPLTGTGVTFSWPLFKTLVDIGGDIMNTGIDTELASIYNYLSMSDFYEGVNKADLDGFYQFNYSPAGIYRQNNWVATMRCPTTKFWGGEIYKDTNRFGRYQAHGTLEIMYDGAWENSGFPKNDNLDGTLETGGWDWNVEAGATTVHYTSWKEMMPNKNLESRFDQYSKTTNFSGALSWNNYGMFGAEFDQGDDWGGRRFTPTNLTFKKSVYVFDGMLISLGSNIGASGEYGDGMITATNLFQGIDSDISGDLIVNGTVMAAGTDPKTNDSSSDLWMVTPQGTGYFVPKGNDPIVIKHGEQSSPNETGSNLDNPLTVTAAKAYINHGVKTSDKKYAFVAVPATNATSMAQLATKMSNNGGEIFEIKAQNDKLHALTYKPANVTAYSIFAAAENLDYGYVKSTASEMLLMEKFDAKKEMLSLAVCNPNLRPVNHEAYKWIASPTVTSIIVKGEWKLNVNVEGVTLTVQADKTTKIDLTLEEGAPVYLDLIDKDAVGIKDMNTSDEVKVYAAGHDVYVVNAVGSVQVYNVAGLFIKSLEADGTAHFTLDEPGCYIVKVNNNPVKVMIK